METTGKLVDVATDFKSRKRRLTFEVDNVSDDELDRLYGLDKVRIRAVKYSEKRGLNANAYFWKLLSLIAAETPGMSDIDLHHKYLSENRVYVIDDGGAMAYIITTEKPGEFGIIRQECGDDYTYYVDAEMGVKMTKANGEPLLNRRTGEQVIGRVFWRVKGTHEMDSKEMSKIIDAVVTDAKELGIETLPPHELEQMAAAWKGKEA